MTHLHLALTAFLTFLRFFLILNGVTMPATARCFPPRGREYGAWMGRLGGAEHDGERAPARVSRRRARARAPTPAVEPRVQRARAPGVRGGDRASRRTACRALRQARGAGQARERGEVRRVVHVRLRH